MTPAPAGALFRSPTIVQALFTRLSPLYLPPPSFSAPREFTAGKSPINEATRVLRGCNANMRYMRDAR